MNLAEMLYQRGWQPVTGEQFLSWYSQRWPSPNTPAKIIVFNDTAREPDGKFHRAELDKTNVEIQDMGQILMAETKYFRIMDHQHRLSPVPGNRLQIGSSQQLCGPICRDRFANR